MDFEKIEKKLQKINKNMGDYTQKALLEKIDKIYEKAKGNEKFAPEFEKTVENIKSNGVLTDKQIETLEEKAKKLSKAVQEAKELRQNSDKDKIDNYIAGKVEENEEEKEHYKEENKILKDQREKLKETFKDYKHNQEAEKVVEKVNKIADKILSEMQNLSDPNKKEQASKKMKEHGSEIESLLGNGAVKTKLGRWNTYFNSDPSKWEENMVNNFKGEVGKLKVDFAKKKQVAEKEFNQKLVQVPNQYRYTAIEAKLQNINSKHKKVEDKWTALEGTIERNESEIKRINAQIQSYKDYAKEVKGIDEAKEEVKKLEEISDEEMESYLREEKGIDVNESVHNTEEMVGLNNILSEHSKQHKELLDMKSKEIDINAAIQWKRQKYYLKHPVKTTKALVKVNKKIAKANKKRDPEDRIEPATVEDIINNTEKIQDLKFKGKNRYKIRSKIPGFKRFYRGQYRKYMNNQYLNDQINLKTHIENRQNELKDDFKAKYRQEVQTNFETKKTKQDELIGNIIRSNTEKER